LQKEGASGIERKRGKVNGSSTKGGKKTNILGLGEKKKKTVRGGGGGGGVGGGG